MNQNFLIEIFNSDFLNVTLSQNKLKNFKLFTAMLRFENLIEVTFAPQEKLKIKINWAK